jgi:hypothetical protein
MDIEMDAAAQRPFRNNPAMENVIIVSELQPAIIP